VFWGLVDRRMDVDWVRALAESLDAGTIVLLGPQDAPDPQLHAIPRVAIRPAVRFERLPAIAAAASVLIMPYAEMEATRAMQPLKLKEYLATGRPAVVRDLPAVRPWADACTACSTSREFTAAVHDAMVGGLSPAHASARRRLHTESWATKSQMLESWMERSKSDSAQGPTPPESKQAQEQAEAESLSLANPKHYPGAFA
jgi:hypothetical protein